MQQELWPQPRSDPRPGPEVTHPLVSRLRRLGLPPFDSIRTHRNRQVMVSWTPEKSLRVHEGYADAPDHVLAAIVRFVTPHVSRATRLSARRILLAFPAESFAPADPGRTRAPERARRGDRNILARLRGLHATLNARYFEGRLSPVPIVLSGRMRRRLGELRLERAAGAAVQIAIGRRHLRRDGWSAVEQTLLHEMIHQWQAETGLGVDHGPEFRRKAGDVGVEPRAVRGEGTQGYGVRSKE